MRIANTVDDSIVDGHGLRFVVFTQGCVRNCHGCHNPGTHDPLGGKEIRVQDIAQELSKNPLIEGLTLSGGEPFLQAKECAELARIAKAKGLNVWTYTGYTYEQILHADNPEWNDLLRQTDVLVDGPFLEEKKSYELHFRGSWNQRLIDVSSSLIRGRTVEWIEHDPLSKFKVPES